MSIELVFNTQITLTPEEIKIIKIGGLSYPGTTLHHIREKIVNQVIEQIKGTSL
jgi:hypothetical protein